MDSLFRTSLLPAHLCQLVKLTTRRAKLVVVQVFQHHDTSTVTAATGQQSPFVVPLADQRTAHPRAAQRDAGCITPPPRIARCADDVLPDVPLVRVALRSSVLPVTSWTQQIRLGKERSSRVEPLVQPCRALLCCYRDGLNQATLYRVSACYMSVGQKTRIGKIRVLCQIMHEIRVINFLKRQIRIIPRLRQTCSFREFRMAKRKYIYYGCRNINTRISHSKKDISEFDQTCEIREFHMARKYANFTQKKRNSYNIEVIKQLHHNLLMFTIQAIWIGLAFVTR